MTTITIQDETPTAVPTCAQQVLENWSKYPESKPAVFALIPIQCHLSILSDDLEHFSIRDIKSRVKALRDAVEQLGDLLDA